MVTGQPWEWPETVWQQQVDRVRAGRSLRPDRWPHGRRAAVALSFDSDHETIPLRDGEFSPCQLSQGEYGSRVAVPKILNLLATHGIPATFFVPAVSALLHPADIDAYVQAGHEVALHGWIHERNTALPPGVERDLALRAADTLERLSGTRPHLCGPRAQSECCCRPTTARSPRPWQPQQQVHSIRGDVTVQCAWRAPRESQGTEAATRARPESTRRGHTLSQA